LNQRLAWTCAFLCIASFPQLSFGQSSCTSARPQNTLFPYYGNADLSAPSVTIYGDAAARGSAPIRAALQSATTALSTACPRGTYHNIPTFNVAADWANSQRPTNLDAGTRDRTTIEVQLIDANAPKDRLTNTWIPALWQGGTDQRTGINYPSQILAYKWCPANGIKIPEWGCTTGNQQEINWGQAWMVTAFTHELGHSLGLDHDRGKDGQGTTCPMTVMNASPNTGAPITADECRQADTLNDDTQKCTTWPQGTGAVNPCENPTQPPPGVNPPGSGGGFSDSGSAFNNWYQWVGNTYYVNCVWSRTVSGGGTSYATATDYETTLSWHCTVISTGSTGATSTQTADYLGPVISLTTPTDGQTVSGVINVSGWAMDFVHLSGVTFGVDHQQVQPGSLSFGYDEPAACQPPNGIQHSACNPNSGFSATIDTTKLTNGTHTLSVVAMGHNGYPSALDRTIVVNNCTGSPTVTISSPATGATVSGAVPVTVSATDSVAISQVSFYVDGILAGRASEGSHVFTWDTTYVAPGSHTLQARALDSCGATAASRTFSVTVAPVPLRLYIETPAYNGTVSGAAAALAGWATDPYRITSLAFWLDGQRLNLNGPYAYGSYRQDVCNAYPGDPNCPYVGWSASFDSTGYSNGTHSLAVAATDGLGQQATANWALNISNAPPPPPPPPTSRLVWIQPQASAGYGPLGSLVVAGNATGGTGGGVQLWYRDATAGDTSWTLVSYTAAPGSDGTWINAIPNVDYSHVYTAVALYSGTWSGYCSYGGNNALAWCP
jgi:hypothetical protein